MARRIAEISSPNSQIVASKSEHLVSIVVSGPFIRSGWLGLNENLVGKIIPEIACGVLLIKRRAKESIKSVSSGHVDGASLERMISRVSKSSMNWKKVTFKELANEQ